MGAQALTQFRSTPGGELLFEFDDQLLDLKGQAIGLAKRASTAIRKSFQTTVFIALNDLMAGDSGNTKLGTQGGNLLAI